jgi:hypothetical protein
MFALSGGKESFLTRSRLDVRAQHDSVDRARLARVAHRQPDAKQQCYRRRSWEKATSNTVIVRPRNQKPTRRLLPPPHPSSSRRQMLASRVPSLLPSKTAAATNLRERSGETPAQFRSASPFCGVLSAAGATETTEMFRTAADGLRFARIRDDLLRRGAARQCAAGSGRNRHVSSGRPFRKSRH